MRTLSIVSMSLGVLFLTASCASAPEGEHVATTAKSGLRRVAEAVPGEYLVRLDESAGPAAAIAEELAGRVRGTVFTVFGPVFNGFAVRVSEAGAEAIARDVRVLWVEENEVVRAKATQTSAPYQLDVIDQTTYVLDSSYTYNSTGSGVQVWVLDTGVLTTHVDFGSRATNEHDELGGTGADNNGHGTQVASIIAGTTYGVAKSATIHSVKVLNAAGSGTSASVISGLGYAYMHATAPAVVSLAAAGFGPSGVQSAINSTLSAGFQVVSPVDTCTCPTNPALNSIYVANHTSSGACGCTSSTCVDLYAPSGATSATYGSTTATTTWNGTSVSVAATTGAIARYLQSNSTATPSQVQTWLTGTTKTCSTGGTPGKALYVLTTL